MKKSTVILLVMTAAFVSCGWLAFDSYGIWLLVAAAITAASAWFTARRK